MIVSFTLEHNSLPSDTRLAHIAEFSSSLDEAHRLKGDPPSVPSSSQPNTSQAVLGAGWPPVPSKLVQRIEEGEFIELSDLLPERLAFGTVDESAKGKTKKKIIPTILEWVQCFSLYTAIVSRKQPERVPDLLGYQSLIIDAHREFKGDYWMGYDRCFRQRAAATHIDKWADVDLTLWSVTFGNRTAISRCSLCLSTAHDSNSCELRDPQLSSTSTRPPNRPSQREYYSSRRRICFEWNESLSSRCSHPNCAYEHICYLCYRDPAVTDKYHKAMKCAKWKPGIFQRPAPTSV